MLHNPSLDEKFKERVDRVARETLQLITWNQIRLSTAARFLITNLIPMVGLVVVYGPPKCGKTFWVFDLVMHIALGWSYRGLRTKQGLIVYCLFEGQANFAARVEAFRQKHLAENGEDVPFLLMCVKLELVKDHPRLIREIIRQTDGVKVAAIVMDTLNRSITGSESSDVDMSNYVKACDSVREAFECAVIIVHHSGLEGGRARGHTSLLGAADAQIGVKQDDAKNVIATVEYMKDGPAGQEIVSRLEVIEVGIDEDGEPITSCIVEPSEPQPKQTTRGKLTPNQETMFTILRKAGATGLTLDEWNERARNAGVGNKRKADLYDNRHALQSKGLIFQGQHGWFAQK